MQKDKVTSLWIIKKAKTVRSDCEVKYPEPEINSNDRDLTAKEINILIKLCENDLYLFAVRYFNHYLKRPSSKFHKYLYRLLNRETNRNKKNAFRHSYPKAFLDPHNVNLQS